MPFNGSGVFQRVRNWVADATAGVKIRADYHDAEDDGFAAGLTNCIAKDGQTIVTQNIPFNSKRITGLQDPVNDQDAATKAYTDTKMPLAGGTMTGPLDVNGTIRAHGYQTRKGLPGPYGGNWFNFDWTGNLEAWIDNTNIGALATQAFANTAASNSAAGKVNRSGDTMGGKLITAPGAHISAGGPLNSLEVTGAGMAAMSFHIGGVFGANFGMDGLGNFYMGGWSHGAGVYKFWTTKDFANVPSTGTVTNGRLAYAGDVAVATGPQNTQYEPYTGGVHTGWSWTLFNGTPIPSAFRFRYVQLHTTGWFTVGYA